MMDELRSVFLKLRHLQHFVSSAEDGLDPADLGWVLVVSNCTRKEKGCRRSPLCNT